MPNRIDTLPANLQRVATRVDSTPGIGNRDGTVDGGEVARGKAAAAANPGAWDRQDTLELDGLAAAVRPPVVLETGGDGPVGAPVGPGGIFESTVYPPANGIQREVVLFATARNAEGLRLNAGATSPLASSLGGDGIVGLRFDFGGTAGSVRATIGGESVPTWGGAVAPGQQPLNGEASLVAGATTTVRSVEVFRKVPSPTESTDYYPLNRTVKAGETLDIPLSAYRGGAGIDQIESIWTASYGVPDPSGRKSDEGKPFWLDGVYVNLFLVDANGVEHPIDRTKFVDANEVDNSHDLGGPSGVTLRYKFFARNPAGVDHPITFRGVRVRHVGGESGITPPASFTVGRTLNPGDNVEVELPPALRGKTIGRVEVRWTDFLSGTWEKPGYAYGTLLVDGKRVSPSESVQSPETQTFSYLGGIKATGGKVGVLIERDRAQIDWIKVYFDD